MKGHSPSRQGWFVWAAWSALLIALLVCIARYGRNIPLAEDWYLVAPYTGQEPDVLQWIWAQNNEHRLPLQRILLLGLLHLTGGDFRAGMYASALLMAAMSGALILTAAAARGGIVRWTDVFFPVLLLNLGHWENYVFGWQLQFTASIALMLALLIAIVRSRSLGRAGWLAIGGVALMLLPLSGANGLIVALALAPWALFAGFRAPGDASSRFARIAAPASITLVGLYFVGYDSPDWTPANPGVVETLKTAAKIAAMGLMPAATFNWKLFVALALPALAVSALPLLRAAWRAWLGSAAEERERVLGMLCYGAGMVGLIAAIGYGRAGYGTGATPYRYALLVAPIFCLAYFVWQLYGPRLASRVQAMFAVIPLLCLPWNVHAGFDWRDWYVNGMELVERDIAAGRSAGQIAADHRAFLLHWNQALLADRIRMLEQARSGPFHGLRNRQRPSPAGARTNLAGASGAAR